MILDKIAQDLHISNPTIAAIEFLKVLESARVWEFKWGVIFAIENEMHIHILTGYRHRVFLRPALQKVANEMFKEYRVLTTRILRNKPEALQFDLRIGWRLVRETKIHWHLESTKEDFKYGKS